MKKFILILTLALITCLAACTKEESISIFSRPTVEKKDGERKDWNDVSSFICYYGDFDVEAQKNFDVVIMHSTTLYNTEDAAKYVKQLQDAGCYVISYITIGEDDELCVGDGLGEGGYASYYIYENGAPKQNSNWGSYFVDAGNPLWQSKVINESKKILDYGVDGLFLDTIDTVDIAYETLPGMADLIKDLKETFPTTKLVANRGFTTLPYMSQYIDGLMFESFNTQWDFELGQSSDLDEESKKYNETLACNVINRERRYNYFPVFALDYVSESEYDYMTQSYYDRSWQYDFIPYNTYDILLETVCYPKNTDDSMMTPKSKRGELALDKFKEESLDGFNGDMSANNLAYKKNGVKVTVDSTFAGYNTLPLNDGWYATAENHIQDNWAKEAWASSINSNTDHWVSFEFSEKKDVEQVTIYWANDNGTFYQARKVIIQALVDGEWVDVASKDNTIEGDEENFEAFSQKWTLTFDKVNTTTIRVLQPKGMGAHDKWNDSVNSGIMWLSEVEIYSEAKND